MSTSLKSQATKGIIWTALGSFSVQGIQFVIGIVLARLLLPSDYGIIGMIAIFLAISTTFVDSGMGSGLIQKSNCTEQDYSTVFVFNFGISVFCYLLLFVAAPYIAAFFKTPALVAITRIVSLNIVISSLTVVQSTRLTKAMDFKKIANINIMAVLVSGLIAIYFAYAGFGVWSLVIRSLASSVITVCLLWYFSRWKFSVYFSKQSFKELFGYGSKLLAAGIYATTLNNIYNIVIGKAYSSKDLGFYTQAKSFADLTAGTVTSVIQQVTFPLLASLKEDQTRMIAVYRRIVKMSSFFIFPAMTLLSILSAPFVTLFLGKNWLFTIPLLQVMAFARIFYPLSALNMNILNANGRSDLFLKVDLAKFPLILIAMAITLPMGVKAMVIGQVITSFLAYFINAYMPGKLYGYGALKQFKDIWVYMIASGLMAAITLITLHFINSPVLQLMVGFIVASFTYILICFLMKVDEITEVKEVLRKLSSKSK